MWSSRPDSLVFRAEINKKHSDEGAFIFNLSKDRVESNRNSIFCGSVGSESIQTGWVGVSDGLQNQFLRAQQS